MEKQFIRNRKGQRIAVIVEESKSQKGLVFVMHGLGGFKEQPHIKTMSNAFKEKGYTVVRFDTTNTLGESDGKYEDATTTNYYEDLEDVIDWAKSQGWYEEPFWMAGHSLGSFCIAYYAENYPDKVKALTPISTVVSRQLMIEAMPKEEVENWKKTGWQIEKSLSKPGVIKKLKWSFVTDGFQYNLLDKAGRLTMPTLLIVGEKDEGTPIEHQKLLYNRLPGKKELHIIKGAPHTFREQEHLDEIKQILLNWIDAVQQGE